MANFLLEGLLQATLCVGILTVIIKLLHVILKDRIAPRYFVWIYGMLSIRLLLLIPVNVPSIVSTGKIIETSDHMNKSISAIAEPNASLSFFKIEIAGINLNIILVLWLTGIGIFLLYALIKYYSFKRNLILHGKTTGSCLWDKCIEYDIPAKNNFKKVEILICNNAVSPLVIGYKRKYLCLPEIALSKSELNMIYRHEASHVRNNDLIWKLLFLIVNAIHWFNPLIYLMISDADEYIELSCDAFSIKDMNNTQRKEYAEILLFMLQQSNVQRTILATCSVEKGRKLKIRFHFLLSNSKKRKIKGLGFGACISCIVLLAVVQIPAHCEILSDYFNNSYIILSRNYENSQKSEKIMFEDLYYSIYDSYHFKVESADNIDTNNMIILNPGNTLVLSPTQDADPFNLSAGDIIEINFRINHKASLKIGLTNGSERETTDTNPNTCIIQKIDGGSLIYIKNQTSEQLEIS